MNYQDDFYLFVQGGHIAIQQQDALSAWNLFQAAAVLNPKNTLPQIGLGYLYLQTQQFKQAAHTFEQVLEKEPSNEMTKAFLGFTTSFLPRGLEKGEKILAESCHSENPLIRKLGSAAISFVECYLRRPPGPAERVFKS